MAPHPLDAPALTRRLDLDQQVRLLTGADAWGLHAEPAVGLRRLVTSDGPAGVRGETWDERDWSANTPSPTALAASWDDDLVEEVGRLLAAEARRKGVDVLLAPTVNLHRTPLGGRHFECFSEDPLVTARTAAAFVRGVQSGGVAATVKHYVANDTETQRLTYSARIAPRPLHELYLAPFEAAVAAGAWAVMAAYNALEGTTMTEHPLLGQLLKGSWGFDGVVMSDWFATRSVEASGRAGLDLAMPGPRSPWSAPQGGLADAVRRGAVPAEAVADKVERLLLLAARTGALDGVPAAAPPPESLAEEAVAALLRRAAVAGTVLLTGADAVPLDAAALRRVAVLGPGAAVARTLGGGSATVFPRRTTSPLQGLREALAPDVEVVTAVGVRTAGTTALAEPARTTTPDGAPGLRVRMVDADGAVVHEEVRSRAQLVWMGGRFAADVDSARVAALEVEASVRAGEDGVHRVGIGATGRVRLEVGGQLVTDEVLALEQGRDLIDALISPPERLREVALAAGETVDVRARVEVPAEWELLGVRVLADPPPAAEEDLLEEAVEAARGSDVAVVVVGTTEEVESEGFDRTSLALPGAQDELVRRVAAVNPRTVVVVNAGAPVLLPWVDDVAAVLVVWFPGQECGGALADVLLGRGEAGGRLTTTWPSADDDALPAVQPVDGVLDYAEGLEVGHRSARRAATAAFPFGHGLGWTRWEVLGVSGPPSAAAGEDVPLQVRVRNAGNRAGRAVLQAYASWSASGLDRPHRALAGYAATRVEPGEEAEAALVVPARSLQHWDEAAGGWATEPADVVLAVGTSSADTPVRHRLRVG